MSNKRFTKTNYFYIDESGGILSNEFSCFILGAVRTDTPNMVSKKINQLLKGFKNELYFTSMLEQIKEQGFHAVENHPDVRAKFYGVLPNLNYRSFFTIINKTQPPFADMINKRQEKEVYLMALDQIVKGRLNNRDDNHVFIFEELQFSQSSQPRILADYFAPYMKEGNVSFQIVGKEDLNLAMTDYMNYIFFSLLKVGDLKKVTRMVDNFELVKPKIAFINILHSGKFLTRKHRYNAEKVLQLYSG